ncbi:hypothetical protein NBRC116583_39190 [Arenicella sp. 4NH20-0111]|uniref:SMI1/KNR4 family protein n=1 Tax=Arenicella sp. 4NH20-0111 TaxID=3127648 RepID=UPI00310A9EB6
MSTLEDQISTTLLPGMHIPKELSLLFNWIEENQYHIDRDDRRIGFLYPLEKLREEWGEDERQGGTVIEFFAEGNVNMHYWFGHERPDVIDRLCVFAKTGAEGSMAAFWLDDNGKQKIVHMGSGSGSTLVCVLSENPIDFLRLLAIGYDEICWNDHFDETPNESAEAAGMLVHPNVRYQNWVESTFKVTIPEKANAIVLHPSEMGDVQSEDEFCQWVETNA